MNDFQNIPADLRASSSWLVWKLGPLNPKTGRHPKLPCNYATGDVTDKADPSVWISFEEAISKAGKFSGIGLLPMGKVIGFDLDKCRDKETGEINTWAKDWIARLNSYTEISPSGDGLHVWFLGEATSEGSGAQGWRRSLCSRQAVSDHNGRAFRGNAAVPENLQQGRDG